MCTDIVAVTAAYGEEYRWAVRGLVASMRSSNASMPIYVFSDRPIPGAMTICVPFEDLIGDFPAYYQQQRRNNVAKFEMVRRCFELSGAGNALWIDADTLVFGDLAHVLVTTKFNLVRHGARNEAFVNCGGDLNVPGPEYVIGSYWMMPNNGQMSDAVERLLRDRLSWVDADEIQSGDQVLLNHLRWSLSPSEVALVDGATSDVVNFAIVETRRGHPLLGRELYRELRLKKGVLTVKDRPIRIWTWTAETLFDHRRTKFSSMRPSVRKLLQRLYSEASDLTDGIS